MKRLLVALSFLLTLFVVGAGGLLAWGSAQFRGPGPLDDRATVRIPSGAGVGDIAAKLADSGVIAKPWVFIAGARLTNRGRLLKAGEYAFPARVSPEGALEIIVRGETVTRKVTLPEGITSADAVVRLRAAEGLKGLIDTVPPEGSLLPETYHYHWGDRRAAIIERAQAAMDDLLAREWPERAANLPFNSKHAAITLASIVEKETAVAKERALVAGVFVNRLRRGMRLQSDPTVRYAVRDSGRNLDGRLTRAHLEIDNPYNTYENDGLPPGPIANPGPAAVKAVLNPTETDYLYFVADGNGGHAFAKTLEGHNRNVARWRRIRDSKTD